MKKGLIHMDDIFEFFNTALMDNRLTRTEAKALKACLKEDNPSYNDLNVLRAKLFKLVSEKQTRKNYAELHLFLEEAVRILMHALKPKGVEVVSSCYFSPGNSCRDAIIERLKQAKHRIHICVFTISDDLITKEILAAHRRGVNVVVVTDNDKMSDIGSDIDQLVNAGIETYIDQTDNHMHHKFAVIDSHWVLSGSFNWTRSASRCNHEDLTVTNEPGVVKSFDTEFERLIPEMRRL